MHLTGYGANTWLIEMADQRILLDPWLVGPLVFGNQDWFFKAEHSQAYEIPVGIDLILLSQGLPDHAHPPTLNALDKGIPVIGSPKAAQVVKKLGYTHIEVIAPGQAVQISEVLEVKAFPGTPLGPTVIENAYVLSDRTHPTSLYYEPHGFHSPELKTQGPVDVVLTPLMDLTLPWVGPFIKGSQAALKLAQWLTPQVMVPTTIGGDVEYSGLLNKFIGIQGDLTALQLELDQLGQHTQILMPPTSATRFEVPLRAYVS